MSANCASNIISTGDFVDNTGGTPKSIYSILSSCDNRATWYVDEADEATQVTMVASIVADVTLQTINERGDFAEEQNKICIHDSSKNIIEYSNTCEDTGKVVTKILLNDFDMKKCYKPELYETHNMTSFFQDDSGNEKLKRKKEFEQVNTKIQRNVFNNNIKMEKNIGKSYSFNNSLENLNDYLVGKQFDKILHRLPINNFDTINEKVNKNIYNHVPHKDRPPMIVARRNARERRRVLAVNNAFMELRKIVPLRNNRGKRISKVKTLQTAIDYINSLKALLKQSDIYDTDIIPNHRQYSSNYNHSLDDFNNESYLMKFLPKIKDSHPVEKINTSLNNNLN